MQPSVVEALEGLTVMQITAGGWHSMALSGQYKDLCTSTL